MRRPIANTRYTAPSVEDHWPFALAPERRNSRVRRAVALGIHVEKRRVTSHNTPWISTADVAAETDVKALIARALSEFGRLDITFNNAGFVGALGPPKRSTVTSSAPATSCFGGNGLRAALTTYFDKPGSDEVPLQPFQSGRSFRTNVCGPS